MAVGNTHGIRVERGASSFLKTRRALVYNSLVTCNTGFLDRKWNAAQETCCTRKKNDTNC